MKLNYLKIKHLSLFFFFGVIIIFSHRTYAQCNNGPFNGGINAPNAPGVNTISSCSVRGTYHLIFSIQAGENYVFASSNNDDFLTISTGSDVALAFGTSPLNWTATFSGNVKLHINANSSCGAGSGCRTTTIECTSCIPPPPGTCIHQSQWSSSSAPNVQGQIESTDCFNTGFYWEYFDISLGETYEFNTNQSSDWITLTDESNNVIVSGNVPLEWESTISGSVKVHLSADNTCATDFNCHALYISCLSCPVPGPCTHLDMWSVSTAPNTSTQVQTTNCIFTQYFWEYQDLQQGETYEFSTTITTDVLVITDESNNVLATTNNGTVSWTATFTGTVRVHLSASEMCDFDFDCHPLYITCTSCSSPPPSACIQQVANTTASAPTNPLLITISGCIFAGEYNIINNIVSGEDYVFYSSITSDLLTLTDENNNILTFGITPLTWTATFSGSVRLHVSVDGSCAAQIACRTTTMEITSLPAGTCVHQSPNGSSNAPQSNAITTVTNCVIPGNYWQFNNIVSGETYLFNTNSPTDYITLTDASNNVLISGLAPVSWTATFSGSVRTHMSLNSSCGSASVCQVLFSTCSSCPSPPPAPCIQPTSLHTANAPISQNPEQINFCSVAGIYNTINNLVSGETYTFTSSIATDYLTLTDENNNPLVFGTTPISWNASFSGTVRLHISQNGECGVQNTCRFASVQCNSCTPPCVFSSSAGSKELLFNCEVANPQVYAGQYNTFSNVVNGETYTFSSSLQTDWLTLTDESNNVLLVGTSPISWTSNFSGSVRLHVSSNTGCSVQIGVEIRVLSGICNSCSPAQVTCPVVTVTSPTSCSPEILAVNWPLVVGAHEYKIFVGTSSGNYDVANGIIYNANTTGVDLQNPAPNQTYYFLVQALNCDGDVSSNCTEISFTTPNGCPCIGTPLVLSKPANSTNCPVYKGDVGAGDAAVFTNISAGETYEIGSGNVDNNNNDWITITDDLNNVLVYGYQPLTWVATFSGTIRVHVVTNHFCFTTGFDRVVSLTCTTCPSPTVAPACPVVNITPEFSCSTPSLFANWTHVPNVAEYKINVAISPGNYYQVISVPPQYTGIQLTNPVPDMTYYFMFETIDCEGNVSTGCQEISFTTPSVCACINPTLFDSSNAPNNQTPAVVSNCMTPGTYWEFNNVVQGRTYVLNTGYYVLSPDNGNEYFTITDTQNNVLAAGGIPFSWTATFSGTIRAHLNSNIGCGIDNDCRDLIITCLDCNTACNEIQYGTDIISSCSPITWIDGNTYSESNNTATHLLPVSAQNGCDSLVTLNFTLWPCTQLQSGDCNATNVSMDQNLRAVNVNAPAYRFKITGPNNGGAGWNGNTFILDRPNRALKFSLVPGTYWGSTYSIEVAVGDGNGNFGPYGNACNVSLSNAIPTTQLQASDCGAINVNPSVNLLAVSVSGATGYRYRVNGFGVAPNTTIEKTMGGGAMRKLKMQEFTGIALGETYIVEVAIRDAAGNWGDYGFACEVTLINAPDFVINNDIEMIQTRDLTSIEFGVMASHNPFTTSFSLQVLNANDSDIINISIYDMSGKLIERQAINPMDIENAKFGMNLASGMYMVEVRQGSNQAVVRQVKN